MGHGHQGDDRDLGAGPVPKYSVMSGANATMGMEMRPLTWAARCPEDGSIQSQRAASANPTVDPMTYPSDASMSVIVACRQSSTRLDRAPAICDG